MHESTRISAVMLVGLAVLQIAGAANPIRLNSLGFLPMQDKRASIALGTANFNLIRADNQQVVFSGVVGAAITNADTDERLFTADFSAFTNAGVFQIEIPGAGRSAPFRIGGDVYREPFFMVTRAMYLWRCGTAVSGTHHGKSMFRAWEDFRPAIQKVTLDLPERGGPLPEFLAELKWELDWLFTMQAADGSVYHKVSTRDFGGFIMPEQETAQRNFVPWSSAATADFVAMLAAGARHFREFDAAYAERCLAAARKSYDFLVAHPDNHRADQTGFSTGAYPTSDGDDRLWAAAELWAATGETNFLDDFETRARGRDQGFEVAWDWGNVRNLGLLTYLFSACDGRDAALVESLRKSLLATADEIVKTRDAHGYARPLGERYGWGCNGVVARQTLVLHAAHRLTQKPEYRDTALDAVGYLFGRNPFGRSFVTGVGTNPPLHPHDRRSGADGIAEPWPGYLVGGPNPKAADWHDVEADYRTNEIAINWNGALIYALAMFLESPTQ